MAERLEAFVSRFGRMQDTMGEKLLPRWLEALGEGPGSMIDILHRAERLNIVEDAAPPKVLPDHFRERVLLEAVPV